MNIVPAEHPALTSKADPVLDVDMFAHSGYPKALKLMREVKAAGIAAPQVGIPSRWFVSKYSWDICINPSWTPIGNNRTSRPESSLNKRGLAKFNSRFTAIKAEWLDQRGEWQEAELTGDEARVFQFLCDLLDGGAK